MFRYPLLMSAVMFTLCQTAPAQQATHDAPLAEVPVGKWQPTGASVKSYSTRFQHDEDPISEDGKWISGAKDGIDWYNVITKNGVAYGAVSKGEYTDPTALLRGTWGKNQIVKAKVHGGGLSDDGHLNRHRRSQGKLRPCRAVEDDLSWFSAVPVQMLNVGFSAQPEDATTPGSDHVAAVAAQRRRQSRFVDVVPRLVAAPETSYTQQRHADRQDGAQPDEDAAGQADDAGEHDRIADGWDCS